MLPPVEAPPPPRILYAAELKQDESHMLFRAFNGRYYPSWKVEHGPFGRQTLYVIPDTPYYSPVHAVGRQAMAEPI